MDRVTFHSEPAEELVFVIKGDTYVSSQTGAQNTNYTTATKLNLSTAQAVLLMPDWADVASVVDGRPILAAHLQLDVSAQSSDKKRLYLHEMTVPWSPDSVTWTCRNDTKPTNTTQDCNPFDLWQLSPPSATNKPYENAPFDAIELTGKLPTPTEFNVTDHILTDAPYGWILRATSPPPPPGASTAIQFQAYKPGARLVVQVPPPIETVCDDGVDADMDGVTDCDDPDCYFSAACNGCLVHNGGCGNPLRWLCTWTGTAATCSDVDECATDNGGCGSGACANQTGAPPVCTEVHCADGIDDEADGAADCLDADCALEAFCVDLPPDPTTIAPPRDLTAHRPLLDEVAFLFTGADPLIVDVQPDALEPHRASLISGRVLSFSGEGLGGVRVEVARHEEYGFTTSRADGGYDLVVNGGETFTVRMSRTGFLTADRAVEVPWERSVVVPDARLVAIDPLVTTITPGAASWAVAEGSVQSDLRGERRSVLAFQPGTEVTFIYTCIGPDLDVCPVGGGTLTCADGECAQPITTDIHVRSTEYTVGLNGPEAMPAPLPAASKYTYAAERSVDEAMATGAVRVEFDPPVIHYVSDFLSVPVGTPVPVGVYDRTRESWLTEANGVVIELVDGAGGVDLDGDGVADNQLLAPGESDVILQSFAVNNRLWRIVAPHFSPGDYNYRWIWATAPAPPELPHEDPPRLAQAEDGKRECREEGSSFISVQNRVLGERIPLVGVGPELVYLSSRVRGYVAHRKVVIPFLTKAYNPPPARVDLSIRVGGQRERLKGIDTDPRGVNGEYVFNWDGLDRFGRDSNSGAEVFVSIDHMHEVGLVPSSSFGSNSGAEGALAPTDPYDAVAPRSQTFHLQLANWTHEAQGLGGWELSWHHTYDPVSRTLYQGDGRQRTERDLSPQLELIASVPSPTGLAFAPDGAVYVASSGDHVVYRIELDGTRTRVAGTVGTRCAPVTDPCGDGAAASSAKLAFPAGLAVTHDGTLYIADRGDGRIRAVNLETGVIQTVAGCTTSGCQMTCAQPGRGDGGPATAGCLNEPTDVVVSSDGRMWIADSEHNAIRFVDVDAQRTITTWAGVVGELDTDLIGDGGPALEAHLHTPTGIALGPGGTLFVADTGHSRVRAVDPSGVITTVAGSADPPCGPVVNCGDGGLATDARINQPQTVTIDLEGNLYVGDWGGEWGGAVRKIDNRGIITTAAGGGSDPIGFYVQPTIVFLHNPIGGRMGPDGRLFIPVYNENKVIAVELPLPSRGPDVELKVPSVDGSQLHVFDPSGRHLRTHDLATGLELYSFTYDGAGRVASFHDRDQRVTTFDRDPATGDVTAIHGPDGHTSTLTMDANGYLATVQTPAGRTYTVDHDANGLMTSFSRPGGQTSNYVYDALGLLVSATDAAGGTKTLASVEQQGGREVEVTTPMGRTRRYATSSANDQSSTWENTSTAGLSVVTTEDASHTATTTWPDGTVTTRTIVADPLWGFARPRPASSTTTIPSGLSSTTEYTWPTPTLANADDPLSVNHRETTITHAGRATHVTWDKPGNAGSTTILTSPMGRTVTSFSDATGRLTRVDAPGLYSMCHTYDPTTGRRIQTITAPNCDPSAPEARVLTLQYDSNGLLTKLTDPLGREVDWTYLDTEGRVDTATLAHLPGDPSPPAVDLAYDANGNMTALAPPSRPDHRYAFTPLDQTAAYLAPDLAAPTWCAPTCPAGMDCVNLTCEPACTTDANCPGGEVCRGGACAAPTRVTDYAWNADRQPDLTTLPTAETIDYVYDDDNQPPGTGSGRLLQIAASATGTASITYDAIGRVATVTSPHAVTTATTWDGPLPLTETWTGGPFGAATHTLTRTWTDGDLRPDGLQVDSAPPTLFTFDDDGLLTQAGPLTLTHDPASGVLTGTTVSALASAVTANGFGELSELRHTANGATLLRETILTRDKLGRVLTLEREQDGVTETLGYTYDTHGHLIEERVNGVLHSTWTWDANNNRLTASGPSGTVTDTVHDAQDRLLSINNGAVAWTWDDAGSLVSRTAANQTTLYTTNAFGQLERVDLPSGPVVEYDYDGAGRRVARRLNGAVTDTWIYQDGLNPVAWFDGAGQLKATFVYASLPHVPDLMITPTATYRLVTDHLGSVTDVVNVVTGAVVQRMRYDTFGVVLSDSQPGLQPFGFAGGLYDGATGLVRFGARDYDAEVGRWISKDPVRFDGGTNLFAYVGGDPVNLVDPSGRFAIGLAIFAGPAVALFAIYEAAHHYAGDDYVPAPGDRKLVLESKGTDRWSAFAKNVEPSPDGCYQVFSHGSDDAIVAQTSPDIENATDLANFLLQPQSDYHKGECVQLFACDTGAGRFGQSLSTALGAPVYAPTTDISYLPSGTYFVVEKWMPWARGEWRRFDP